MSAGQLDLFESSNRPRDTPRAQGTPTNIRGLRNADDRLPPVMTQDRLAVARRAGAVALRGRRQFYDDLVLEMKHSHGISVRKWRQRMSGVAYELRYRDGSVRRVVVAPRPRSAVSASIFLHEVGHHAIGFRKYRPRCLEEYHVWQWAFEQMRLRNIEVDHRVERHYRRSMYYYLKLAKKRGLRQVPEVLLQFEQWPG